MEINIDKLIDGYYESDIHQYYQKYGENRANQNAVSSLRMKYQMPKIRKEVQRLKVFEQTVGPYTAIKSLEYFSNSNEKLRIITNTIL